MVRFVFLSRLLQVVPSASYSSCTSLQLLEYSYVVYTTLTANDFEGPQALFGLFCSRYTVHFRLAQPLSSAQW